MKTNEEFVSRVINNLKGVSKDGHVSRRFILGIGNDKARFLMAQKLDEMTLFREEGIISHIGCFRLEEEESISCDVIDFKHCKSVMKSVKKIPEGLFGKNGSGIILVTTADSSQVFDPISPRGFINLQNRKHARNKTNYYTIQNGYLYLPNSEVELVNIDMFALKKEEVEERSECCETKTVCKSYWKLEFVCPDRFYDLVVKDTLQEVASIYRTSVEDTNPNLDENSKGKTTP